ncbi:tryptophan--tRNA ligase [Nocardia sp. NEAU-G5]|uniref:Tryptophan--tRNA ligase n=1 Tax=Nocardia albiluteola TaxID=2842303 RepID=A0ABS6BC09_9NOCA|nr:tryptophan--tRNA ligase [Nocardia albiluteola]MBU3066748.1 tryptophan--tRNA ligase [Nocardia albiluteola]
MSRRITGLTPSGELHLGNYFGAIKPLVDHQVPGKTITFVSDLHALTLDHDPAQVRRRTMEFATMLLAAGVDPERTVLFVQSHVAGHAELHYLLESATGYGEVRRMIQFREKSRNRRHTRVSLLTYPVLMAADILLYDALEVPVGEDQRQHVELARDIAERFNAAYGPVFTPPRMVNPPVAARIMDLTRPTAKMSKSVSAAGSLRLLDPPEVLRHTVMRAVTDAGDTVEYDPAYRPGLANLLTILAACTGEDPARLAGTFRGYRQLKEAVADAVVAVVEPIQRRYAALGEDPDQVRKILRDGAIRAGEIARGRVDEAKRAIGLLSA